MNALDEVERRILDIQNTIVFMKEVKSGSYDRGGKERKEAPLKKKLNIMAVSKLT